MKKFTYGLIWVFGLIVFNVIAFLCPSLPHVTKYTTAFWIEYGVSTAIFIINLINSVGRLNDDDNKMQAILYSIIAANTAITSLCILISGEMYWIIIIIAFFALLIESIVLTKSKEDKTDEECLPIFFIQELTSDAYTLYQGTQEEDKKKTLYKLYEAVRYSDPVSDERVSDIEEEIKTKFIELNDLIKASLSIDDQVAYIITLLNNRNNKIKMLKSN